MLCVFLLLFITSCGLVGERNENITVEVLKGKRIEIFLVEGEKDCIAFNHNSYSLMLDPIIATSSNILLDKKSQSFAVNIDQNKGFLILTYILNKGIVELYGCRKISKDEENKSSIDINLKHHLR